MGQNVFFAIDQKGTNEAKERGEGTEYVSSFQAHYHSTLMNFSIQSYLSSYSLKLLHIQDTSISYTITVKQS